MSLSELFKIDDVFTRVPSDEVCFVTFYVERTGGGRGSRGKRMTGLNEVTGETTVVEGTHKREEWTRTGSG